VTLSLSVCFRPCVPFFFSVLGVLSSVKVFQECLKNVLRVFEVSRMFPVSFKGVYKKFQGSVKGLQGSFKSVTRKFQGNFKGVSSNFKGVSRVFVRSLKGVSVKFQWCYNAVSRKFPRSVKEVSRVFQ